MIEIGVENLGRDRHTIDVVTFKDSVQHIYVRRPARNPANQASKCRRGYHNLSGPSLSRCKMSHSVQQCNYKLATPFASQSRLRIGCNPRNRSSRRNGSFLCFQEIRMMSFEYNWHRPNEHFQNIRPVARFYSILPIAVQFAD
jgi:hypothetical protein